VTLLLAMRLCLALFLIPAAVRKLADHPRFIRGVIDYQLAPAAIGRTMGIALPWAELLLGISLLMGVAVPASGLATALLVGAFTGAIYLNLRRGREISCNCYQVLGTDTIGGAVLARNCLLVAMALIVSVTTILTRSGNWLVPWAADRTLLASPLQLALVALMLGWFVSVVYLTEWTLHTHFRSSKFRQLRGR
jgi:hypothetical protein